MSAAEEPELSYLDSSCSASSDRAVRRADVAREACPIPLQSQVLRTWFSHELTDAEKG